MTSRIGLGVAVAALLSLSVSASGAFAQANPAKARILLNWFPQADQSGYWRAQLNGAAKNGGVDVEIVPGGPRIQTIPQVASGQAEFGIGNADDLMIARQKGAPVRAVFVSLDYVPYTLVYHEGAGIASVADLKTKTVAVALGSAYWEWIKKNNGLAGVREIPLSGDLSLFRNDPNMVQQGYSIFLPYRMTAAGIANGQFKVADLGYKPYNVLFTTDDMIANNPDLVRRTVAAVKQGWIDFMRDPAATRDILLKANTQIPPDVHDKAVAEMISELLPRDPAKIGCMSAARWSETAKQLVDVKFLDAGFDPAKAFDASFTPGC